MRAISSVFSFFLRLFSFSLVRFLSAVGALVVFIMPVLAIFAPSLPATLSAALSQNLSQEKTQTLRAQRLDLPPLEVGDLIFRRGNSLESAIISQVSRHHYTHLGLVIATKPLLIIHATTDDNPKKQDQVIISSLDEFLSRATSLAIKRLPLTSAQKDSITLNASAQLGRAFVLEVSDALYCTTFVESALLPHIALNLAYDEVDLPTWRGKYLFPKAFFDAPQGRLIYEKRLFDTPF